MSTRSTARQHAQPARVPSLARAALVGLCATLLIVSVGEAPLARARSKASADAPLASGGPIPNAPPGAAPLTTFEPTPARAVRVLMIGNSYTLHHSLHQMLQRVAAGVPGGPQLIVDIEAHGGYSLRNHLHTGQALARIRSGHYQFVVLQGHSMSAVYHPDELAEDAERFKRAIDAVSGHAVLYATWARSPEVRLYQTNKIVHSFAEMTARVDGTYTNLSEHLSAGLAPVGRAFARALVEYPRLALWGSDGSHPSVAGSYMAACVLYGAITGGDPRETTYVPPGLPASSAELVRTVAYESLSAHEHETRMVGEMAGSPGPT